MRLHAISNDEWPDLAKRLPIGQKRRTFHSCQTRLNKTSLEYGRESDYIWVKCHRCGYSQRRNLTHVAYRPADVVQVKVPQDLVPITEVIAKHPRRLLPVLERENLLPYLSKLKASEAYGRIYLPDDSGSYCGLDFTGNQFIPWRSPHKHSMALKHRHGTTPFMIVSTAQDYMEVLGMGYAGAVVFGADTATIAALITHIVAGEYKFVVIQHHPSAVWLRKELSTFCEVQIIGE